MLCNKAFGGAKTFLGCKDSDGVGFPRVTNQHWGNPQESLGLTLSGLLSVAHETAATKHVSTADHAAEFKQARQFFGSDTGTHFRDDDMGVLHWYKLRLPQKLRW